MYIIFLFVRRTLATIATRFSTKTRKSEGLPCGCKYSEDEEDIRSLLVQYSALFEDAKNKVQFIHTRLGSSEYKSVQLTHIFLSTDLSTLSFCDWLLYEMADCGWFQKALRITFLNHLITYHNFHRFQYFLRNIGSFSYFWRKNLYSL